MISNRLDERTMMVLEQLQNDLYTAFYKVRVTPDITRTIATWIKALFHEYKAHGHVFPHFDLWVGVCPFDPSRIEIYDGQNFDYIFPKERVPKWAVKVSI